MTNLIEFQLADLARARVLMREHWGPIISWSSRYQKIFALARALEIRLATSVPPPYAVDMDVLTGDDSAVSAIAMFSWVQSAISCRSAA